MRQAVVVIELFDNLALHQCRNVTPDGVPQQLQVVATFQQPNHPPRGMFLGDAEDLLGHLGKIAVF